MPVIFRSEMEVDYKKNGQNEIHRDCEFEHSLIQKFVVVRDMINRKTYCINHKTANHLLLENLHYKDG